MTVPRGDQPQSRGPLSGTRVLEFCWIIAGPLATQVLAHWGAEVIRVESAARMDVSRQSSPYANNRPDINGSGYFSSNNSSKLSLNLNMTRPHAIETVKELVRTVDVVVENFSPKAMRNWGLDYPNLRRLRPDLVMVSMAAHGQTGPYAMHPAIGYLLTGLTGFAHFTGWPDRAPLCAHGAYTDFFVHHFSSSALLAALDHRRRTGQGQYIDLAQTEASINFLTPSLLEYSAAGRDSTRAGNRHPQAAPHGVYRCEGDSPGGDWCAIAIFTDDEWRALCRVAGHPEWADDPRFTTTGARLAHAAILDRLVGEWTATRPPTEVMESLQAAGVPAGAVRTVEGLRRDPQLLHRGHFVNLPHPVLGPDAVISSRAMRLSRTPMQPRRAPLFGEHNEYVYRGLLGKTEDEVADLYAEGLVE